MRLFQVAQQVTNHIAFYLPRNSNIDQVSTQLQSTYVTTLLVCVFGRKDRKKGDSANICRWLQLLGRLCHIVHVHTCVETCVHPGVHVVWGGCVSGGRSHM